MITDALRASVPLCLCVDLFQRPAGELKGARPHRLMRDGCGGMSEISLNMSPHPALADPTRPTTFPVAWLQVFKSLSIHITIAILVAVTAIMAIRYVTSGFDYAKTFQHVTPSVILLVLLGTSVFSMILAFLIAMFMKFAAITIREGAIHGRNYWYWKGRIPLSDITELSTFSNNGINAIVVHSKYHGKIYISDKTERLEELLEILVKHLPEKERAGWEFVPGVDV
jgi:hypothetical protein